MHRLGSLGNYNQLLLLTRITFWLILLLGWGPRKKIKKWKKVCRIQYDRQKTAHATTWWNKL